MHVTENGFGRQWSSHREDGSSRLSFSEASDTILKFYRVLPSTAGRSGLKLSSYAGCALVAAREAGEIWNRVLTQRFWFSPSSLTIPVLNPAVRVGQLRCWVKSIVSARMGRHPTLSDLLSKFRKKRWRGVSSGRIRDARPRWAPRAPSIRLIEKQPVTDLSHHKVGKPVKTSHPDQPQRIVGIVSGP